MYDSLFDTSTPADSVAAQKLLANFEPMPALATKWESSDDNKTWTITLNTKAKSAAGNLLTSADVLWSFERNLAMKWYGGIFLNRIGVTDISQVTAPSTDTIVMKLNNTVGRTYFLQLLGCFIVPIFDSTLAKQHATASDKWASKWISKNGCGFGPYTLASVSPDGSLAQFVANPNYYGEKPIPKVTWRQTTETSTQLQLLLRGEAQVIDSLSPVQLQSVQKSSVAKVTITATTGATFIGFNNSSQYYKDVALHQGMAYALPFDEIVNSVYKGQAKPMKSVLPDFFQGATSEYWKYSKDLAKAKSMLAPYKGKNLVLQYRSGDTVLQTLAILIQSSLKTVGLDIGLQAMDPTSYQTKLTAATLSMWLDTQSTPLVPDALYGLQLLFPTKPTQVLIHYSNAKVDAAVDGLARASDPTAQVTFIKQAQEQIMNDLPILPLAQVPGIVPTAKNVSGIRAHGANFIWAKGLKDT
jgi:peptide/nickel transport system substrate-binding protein